MSVQETREICELTATETNDVCGGFWLLDLLRWDMGHYYEGDVPDLSEVLSESASK